MMPRLPAVAGTAALAWVLFVGLGCEERSDCERACRRVALCKQREIEGERIGEKAPPADEPCMQKCKSHPEEFAACEAKKRTCPELRGCHGPFR